MRALLIVDVQDGFLTPSTAHVPRQVTRLHAALRPAWTVATRFVNPQDSNYRRLMNWQEMSPGHGSTNLDGAVESLADDVVVKSGYGLRAAHMEPLARFDEVYVCGIDTDACVLAVALGLFDAGIRLLVVEDACASTGGPEIHTAGLALLRRNLGRDQVVRLAAIG